ncbi:MAG: von Willebrand factor type A domain-containing protein [bacterium]
MFVSKKTAVAALLLTASCAADQAAESARPEGQGAVAATSSVTTTEDYREAEEMMPAAPAPMAKRESRDDAEKSRDVSTRQDGAAVPAKSAPSDAPEPEAQTGEEYTDYGVNKATKTSEDRFSTFSIDVDTGAYTIARRKLNEGQRPNKAGVRVEEFVNFFGYDYPSPDRGAFGVHMEAASSPFTAKNDTYLLRIGVQGKRISSAERKPIHLTFLVDVSGSMSDQDKLPLAQESLKILTNSLREGDTVALATYAGRVAEILPPTGVERKSEIMQAIDNLQSGGGTGMNSGMELAYKLALTNYQKDHVNRVIVLSDGDANIGPMSHQDIIANIQKYVEEGVTLSTIGLGMGNYKDTMMEQLANKGNGNYYYVDSRKEALRVFGEQVDGTLQVIAKDVKIQVEFDPEVVPEYRLIGYENRDIADKDFRDDKVDAGEIGAGHTVTALYEIKMKKGAKRKLATVRVRHKQPDGYKATEQAFELTDADVRARVADASKDFQFAAAVAAFAEILRESPYAKNISLDLVEEIAKASAGNREDRKEFLGLIKKARRVI